VKKPADKQAVLTAAMRKHAILGLSTVKHHAKETSSEALLRRRAFYLGIPLDAGFRVIGPT
jgi:hypothetical protein